MTENTKLSRVLGERFPQLIPRLGGLSLKNVKALALSNASSDWTGLLERWLGALDLQPNTAYALTGFGDGSHVLALLDRLPQNSYIFCGEKNWETLASEGALELLEDPRLFLGIGELDADYFESVSRMPTTELTDAKAIVFAPVYNGDPDYYASFLSEFARSYDYWRKLWGTNLTASGKWQKNTFENAHTLVGAPDIQELKGAFSGIPIVMVSAGPSLDVSIDFVKAQQNRCVVVAVNSSYRALRNAGVIPDFVIAADPYEYTDRGFEGVACDQTVLICPFIVFPKVVERFQGRVFTWSQNNLLASYLRLVTGKGMGSEIREVGTVSACIFDIAKILGSPQIVFVGQDLAAKADGQLHNSDSFYADLGTNRLKDEECRLVPGNVDESVKVEAKLYVYLKAFESLAREYGSDIELFNTSRFGARVEGIPYVSTEEAPGLLERPEGASLTEGRRRVWQVLGARDPEVGRLSEVLESLSSYGKTICRSALSEALALEKAIDSDGEGLQCGVERAQEGRRSLEARIAKDEDLQKVVEDGAFKYEQALYRRAIQQDLAEDPVRRRAKSLLEYFWSVAEGAFCFYREAEKTRHFKSF